MSGFFGPQFYHRAGLLNFADIFLGEGLDGLQNPSKRLAYFRDASTKRAVYQEMTEMLGKKPAIFHSNGLLSDPADLNSARNDFSCETKPIYTYLMKKYGLTPIDFEANNFSYLGTPLNHGNGKDEVSETLADGSRISTFTTYGFPGLIKHMYDPQGQHFCLLSVPDTSYSHVTENTFKCVMEAMEQSGVKRLPFVLHDSHQTTRFMLPEQTAEIFIKMCQEGKVTHSLNIDESVLRKQPVIEVNASTAHLGGNVHVLAQASDKTTSL